MTQTTTRGTAAERRDARAAAAAPDAGGMFTYRQIITSTADEVNPRSTGAFLGAGRINAFKAVSTLKPVPVPTRPARAIR